MQAQNHEPARQAKNHGTALQAQNYEPVRRAKNHGTALQAQVHKAALLARKQGWRAARERRAAREAKAERHRRERYAAIGVSLLAHMSFVLGLGLVTEGRPRPRPPKRIVTVTRIELAQELETLPAPIEPGTEAIEEVELDLLDEPELVSREFPPEPPEPIPELDPLPFEDPRGVRLRTAPFSDPKPPEPLEPEPAVALAPIPPADPGSSPEPEVPEAEERGATRGPELIEGVDPAYPAVSRRLGETGTVLCRLWIDAWGQVERVEIEQSSGHARLDRAAREALGTWRFRAALDDGLQVPSSFVHRVRFRIE